MWVTQEALEYTRLVDLEIGKLLNPVIATAASCDDCTYTNDDTEEDADTCAVDADSDAPAGLVVKLVGGSADDVAAWVAPLPWYLRWLVVQAPTIAYALVLPMMDTAFRTVPAPHLLSARRRHTLCGCVCHPCSLACCCILFAGGAPTVSV